MILCFPFPSRFLQNNFLTGQLPPFLLTAKITSLYSISVFNPDSLPDNCTITQPFCMCFRDLSYNRLGGPIPSSFLDFRSTLRSANAYLTGNYFTFDESTCREIWWPQNVSLTDNCIISSCPFFGSRKPDASCYAFCDASQPLGFCAGRGKCLSTDPTNASSTYYCLCNEGFPGTNLTFNCLGIPL